MPRECRFCLSSTNPTNLFSPCHCIGSAKYVHKDCLKHWIRVTPELQHKQFCQLCLGEYQWLRKYPIEIVIDTHGDPNWFLLSRSYIFIVLTIYAQLILEAHIDTYLYRHNLLQCTEPYMCMFDNNLIHAHYVRWGFMTCLAVITCLYASYYATLITPVRNKWRYVQYTLRCDYGADVWVPINYYGILGLCLILSGIVQFPSGIMYVFLLSRFPKIHTAILDKMNEDRENPIVE